LLSVPRLPPGRCERAATPTRCAAGRWPRASAPASTTSRPRPTAASGSRRSAAATSAGSIPASGKVELVALGGGSSPHGVIQGPDKAAWLTDSGQNAIVRVGWPDRAVRAFPLPAGTRYANLNTAAFDGDGDLWFTGQSGFVGKVETKTGTVTVKESPRGSGPYGICTTPAATSGGARSPARSSPASTARPATRTSSSRRRRARAHAASGATARAGSGSANG
jgi:virginiamycin B lyase